MRLKVYSVTFNTYTDVLRETVQNEATGKYLNVPKNLPFLIFEDEISKYMQYGNGFATMTCVGAMDREYNITDFTATPSCTNCKHKEGSSACRGCHAPEYKKWEASTIWH